VDILVRAGPFGLFEMARVEYGYQELAEGYAGKCHLCVDVRRCFYQRGEFAELRPGGFYEEEGDQSGNDASISFQNTQKGIRHSLSAVIK
jgi:hypothetical protein